MRPERYQIKRYPFWPIIAILLVFTVLALWIAWLRVTNFPTYLEYAVILAYPGAAILLYMVGYWRYEFWIYPLELEKLEKSVQAQLRWDYEQQDLARKVDLELAGDTFRDLRHPQ